MLAGDWAGDLVVFLGDYARFENESNPARRRVEQLLGDKDVTDLTLSFKVVTGRFDYVATFPDRRHWLQLLGTAEHHVPR